MKQYAHIYICLIAIIVSCSTNSVDDVDLSLNGTSVKIASSNDIKYPRMMLGEVLISNQAFGKKDYFSGVIHNNEWKESEPLFSVGHGHNEFTWIRFAKGHQNSMLLMDGIYYPLSLTVIPDCKSIDDIKDTSKWKKYDLKKNSNFLTFASNFCSMSDSTILIVGTPQNTPGHLLSIVNYKNSSCIPLDYWPNDGIETDSIVKHCVYGNESMTFGNGKGHYLYLCGRERYAFIFSIDGDKVNIVKNLYTTYLNYTTKDHHNPIRKQVRTEGLACYTNDNYVYLLLTDTDRKGRKIDIEDYDHQLFYGNIIEVYDWDGNLHKKIKLDHSGQRIMLSDDAKILYLFSDDYWEGDINPQIWSYDITNI